MTVRLPALALLLAAASCGYTAGDLRESRRVKLRILENFDERRTHEFDLTRAIARELAARGVQVNAADADVELQGTILSVTQPSVVEGRSDVIVVGAVSFRLEIAVVDAKTGAPRRKMERTESASFSTDRAESRETARQEVFDRLAEWAVRALEKDW